MEGAGLRWTEICLAERAWLDSLSMAKSTSKVDLGSLVMSWFYPIRVSSIGRTDRLTLTSSWLWTTDPTNCSLERLSQFLHPQTKLEFEVSSIQVNYADKQQRVHLDHLQLGRARRHPASLPYHPNSAIRLRLHSPRDHERVFASQEPRRHQRVSIDVRQW